MNTLYSFALTATRKKCKTSQTKIQISFYIEINISLVKRACKIVSVALLQNPNVKRVTIFDFIKSGGVRLLFPVGFKSLIKFFDLSKKSHKPCEKYRTAWYVKLLAVIKNHKGQGLGSDMLNNCLIPHIKSEGGTQLAPITNTEQNCKFHKKNGFDMLDETMLKINDKQVNNYCFILISKKHISPKKPLIWHSPSTGFEIFT